MDRNTILVILGITSIALAVAILLPSGREAETNPRLPWVIDIEASGSSRVFDLTLGSSTLADARMVFGADGKVNIFLSPTKIISLEAYFNRLYLSGIKADVVLSLDIDQTRLASMYERGIRISQLGDGSKKVKLAPADTVATAAAVIQQITYLPAANLDAELITKRFGKPNSIIMEKAGIEHWLYPKIGLDIALNPHGKEVFQYVRPAAFQEVTKPLSKEGL